MKNTLIKIQNFFLALAMVVRHPVKAPELMLARRNEEELAADIETINRERIISVLRFMPMMPISQKREEWDGRNCLSRSARSITIS